MLGLGIFTSILPLLSPEKGEQMAVAVQGVLLLVSGVYYPLDGAAPVVFRIMGDASPLTYTLTGIGSALLDHAGAGALLGTILLLLGMGAVLIPCGILVFAKRRNTEPSSSGSSSLATARRRRGGDGRRETPRRSRRSSLPPARRRG